MNRLKNLRNELHQHPELSHQEHQTITILWDYLSKNTTLRLVREEGWFYGVHKEGDNQKTIAIRADMDAILNSKGQVFHGCGHDGHSTVLAGLADAIEGQRLGVNLIFVFQPAEEVGEGAKRVCESLLAREKVDVILGFHNIPGFETGKLLLRQGCFACASKGFTIQVNGRQSHAAYPDQGVNPSVLLCSIVVQLKDMITSIQDGKEDRLIMATVVHLLIGDKNFGISAGNGELSMTLRSYKREDMEALEHLIRQKVEEECRAQNITCIFKTQDSFPDTVNDDKIYNKIKAYLDKRDYPYECLDEPMRWSEDFGWYQKQIPGVFIGIGAGKQAPSLHTDNYEFNDQIIEPAVTHLREIISSLA